MKWRWPHGSDSWGTTSVSARLPGYQLCFSSQQRQLALTTAEWTLWDVGEGPSAARLHSRWPCQAFGTAHWELHHDHGEGFGGLYLSRYWNCDWHDEKYRSSTQGWIEPLCRCSSITAQLPAFCHFLPRFTIIAQRNYRLVYVLSLCPMCLFIG